MKGGFFGAKSSKKIVKDERKQLYPKIDYTHGTQKGTAVRKKKSKASLKKKETEVTKENMPNLKKEEKYKETNINDSAVKERIVGGSFAPITVVDPEKKMIRALKQLEKDYAVRTTARYTPNYDQIDKKIRGPVLKKHVNQSINPQAKLEELKRPGPGAYHEDKNIIQERKPDYSFPK